MQKYITHDTDNTTVKTWKWVEVGGWSQWGEVWKIE